MSKEDPKPGRWILPIVVAALIGFTYVFVNALPPADVAASTTTTAPTTTTTTTAPTTTSTLPTDILAFLAEVDRFEATAADLLAELNSVNEQWENREETGVSYDETLDAFTAVHDDAQDLANQVAATTVPEPYPPAWPDTITASQDLVAKAEAVIEGLKAPDDGSLRRTAVQEYNDATVAFAAQLDVVRGLTPKSD